MSVVIPAAPLGVLAIRDPGEDLERRRLAVAKHVEAARLERDLACPLRSFGWRGTRRGPRRAAGTCRNAAGLGRLGLRLAHRREPRASARAVVAAGGCAACGRRVRAPPRSAPGAIALP